MVRRIIGVLMLVVGIIGVALSLAGIVIGVRVVDQVATGLQGPLSLTSRSLEAVEGGLVQTKTTLENVNRGMDAVVEVAAGTSQLIESTGPLLEQVSRTAGENLPEGIDEVQTVVSDVAVAAKAIYDTLEALSGISGFLGLDLDIATSLEEPINEVGTSLDDLSGDVRDLGESIDETVSSIESVSQDASTISEDLEAINDDLGGLASIVDEYIGIVREMNESVRQMQADIDRHRGTAKAVVAIIMIWIGLTHITPLYLGWELVTGRRNAGLAEKRSD